MFLTEPSKAGLNAGLVLALVLFTLFVPFIGIRQKNSLQE
jgi:hypothetical protein